MFENLISEVYPEIRIYSDIRIYRFDHQWGMLWLD
jgi:hypothetical protein